MFHGYLRLGRPRLFNQTLKISLFILRSHLRLLLQSVLNDNIVQPFHLGSIGQTELLN